MLGFGTGSSAKYIYVLCGVTLIGLNIWSLTVVRELRQRERSEPPSVSIQALAGLRGAKLKDGTRPFEGLGQHGPYALLFIVSPFDCPTAIDELDEIQRLGREEPWLDIRVVMSSVSPEEARQTAERFHLTSPVIADTDSRLRNLLSPPQTPWKVLFNTATGQAIMEDGPSIAPEEKTAFHNRVVYLLRGAQNAEGPRL
jgi:hypothetical protein